MRGGLQLEDAYNTSWEEREAIAKLVEKNLKTTKETGISFV
jgi:hypothetical protein